MAGIGIVSNPGSRRNRHRPETASRLARLLGDGGAVREAATPADLADALGRFRAAGTDVLGVNGGDGTVHVVLSAMLERWPPPWPRLLLLRGGAMNTAARAHGIREPPEAFLARFLAARRAGAVPPPVERDLLRIEVEGRPPLAGFLFGTGAAVAFLDSWYTGAEPSAASAAWLLLRGAASALAGGPLAERLLRREPLAAVADGEEWPADAFLAVVAGAVPEIGFGFRALVRCEEQPGFFHAVGITGSAARLVLRLPALRLGRAWTRPLAFDQVARELVLDSGGDLRFTVDGDLYAARGPVAVRAGPVVEVVVA